MAQPANVMITVLRERLLSDIVITILTGNYMPIPKLQLDIPFDTPQDATITFLASSFKFLLSLL